MKRCRRRTCGRRTVLGFAVVAAGLLAGCRTQHEVQTRSEVDVRPIEIKPIHITVDVNVKVDRELDNFFDDLDEAAEKK